MGALRQVAGARRRVFPIATLIMVLAAGLTCGVPVAAGSSPSSTGTPGAAANTGGGSSMTAWILVGVVAFVGAGVVVWLGKRGRGRAGEE